MQSALRSELTIGKDMLYLNTGGQGPLPASSLSAMVEAIKRNGDLGPGSADGYGQSAEIENRLRSMLADLAGARTDEIAVTTSTGEGLAVVAAALSLRPGDEVIVSDEEHPAGLIPWYQQVSARGIRVSTVSAEPLGDFVERVEQAITDRTRVLSLSHVAFRTGAVLPIRSVCDLARKHNIFTLVDGAQSVGIIPVDFGELGVDAYSFPGQKWLLGPLGTGGLYVRRDAWPALTPAVITSAGVSGYTPDAVDLVDTASRFGVSRPGPALCTALTRSVELLSGIGADSINRIATGLTNEASELLAAIRGIRVHTPRPVVPHIRSGLVTFSARNMSADRLAKALGEEDRIVVRTVKLPDLEAVRISLHCFHERSDLTRLTDAVTRLARRGC